MEALIETYIKKLIWVRTGETIYIDLSTPSVVLIRDAKKRGSTALAALWINILQHPNNYPVQHYPYRKLYQKNGTYNVVLTVDDVTLTVSMTQGSLKMKGEFILHWFQTQFLKVLDAYDSMWTSPQPLMCEKYSQMTKTWTPIQREIDEKRKKEEAEKEKEKEGEEKTSTQISSDKNDTESQEKTTQTVQSDEKGEDTETEQIYELLTEETEENTTNSDEKLEENLHSNEDLTNALQSVNDERGSGDNIEKQAACLYNGCVQSGPDYIYILWKSLLDQWFKDPANRVYIVTPLIDVDRLNDICSLVLKHRLTANLEALYVHHNCDLVQNIGDVKRSVQKSFLSKDQVFIEYKIYSNIVYPLAEFQCKFIACVKGKNVKVLQTSANFHFDHFDKDSIDTVSFHQMSKDEFHQRFLKPILASQVLEVKET